MLAAGIVEQLEAECAGISTMLHDVVAVEAAAAAAAKAEAEAATGRSRWRPALVSWLASCPLQCMLNVGPLWCFLFGEIEPAGQASRVPSLFGV